MAFFLFPASHLGNEPTENGHVPGGFSVHACSLHLSDRRRRKLEYFGKLFKTWELYPHHHLRWDSLIQRLTSLKHKQGNRRMHTEIVLMIFDRIFLILAQLRNKACFSYWKTDAISYWLPDAISPTLPADSQQNPSSSLGSEMLPVYLII